MALPKYIIQAVQALSKLPSIGPRAAERIVLTLLSRPDAELDQLAKAILNLKQNHFCKRCFNLAEADLCWICQDKNRDQHLICVVEDQLDLLAIEKQNLFSGVYHILGGTLKIGQKDNRRYLKIDELQQRVKTEQTKEVVIATNPTTDGDITAAAVKEALFSFPKLKITRLSRGLPTGGDLAYADRESLSGAFNGRNDF